MNIRCKVIWTRFGKPAIRVKHNGVLSDWIAVEKLPALMSFIDLDEALFVERPTSGETQFVSFQNPEPI